MRAYPSCMAAHVSLYEAKTHLSRLVDEAASGAEVIITKNGRPCAGLVPLEATRPARQLGQWRAPVRIAANFDAALDPQDFLEGR